MQPVLEVRHLRKSFAGIAALSDGSFRLQPGSVHALCGGNGAGKSTFLKIIMGIQPRDGGEILRNGRAVDFASPAGALANGIAMVEQELSPVPAMSVAENIWLGREPLRFLGRVDFAKMNRQTQELLDGFGFDIRATDLMMDLTVAQTQLVEIAKALSHEAEVIILDEPTSALGEAEAEQLFAAIRRLSQKGCSIIYVSHRLSEIFAICDSFTVFRDGAFIREGAISEIDKDQLIALIVGRRLNEEYIKESEPLAETVLEVQDLGGDRGLEGISFSARKGEILGIYGLMGAGRTEVLDRLFGLSRNPRGRVMIGGEEISLTSPAAAIAAGLAYVTEDRKGSGLVLSGSVRDNLALTTLGRLSDLGVMRPGREKAAARQMIGALRIKCASDQLGVASLSGGNQQKVVLGKWFLTAPQILLLDEPTRGVDVGAKREIYRVMSDFAKAGGTVIMVSSESEELLGMADRVIVLKDGRMTGALERGEMSAARLLHLAV